MYLLETLTGDIAIENSGRQVRLYDDVAPFLEGS